MSTPRKPRFYLWIDQYGAQYCGASLADVCRRHGLSGRRAPMYRDLISGETVRVGSVVGRLWLTQYAPVEEVRS